MSTEPAPLDALIAGARLPKPTVALQPDGAQRLEWIGRDTTTVVVRAGDGTFHVVHEPFPGQSLDIDGIASPALLLPVLRNLLRGYVPLPSTPD